MSNKEFVVRNGLVVTANANITNPTLLVAGQNVLASIISANNYAGYMANSSNAYTYTSTNAANNYAGAMANSANAYAASLTPDLSPAFNKANAAYTVANSSYDTTNVAFGLTNTTYAAVNSAFGVINASFGSTNTVGGYANTVGGIANAAFIVANAAYGNANAISVAANNWANTVGASGNVYVNTATQSANNYAGAMANASNGYAVSVGASGNNYAGIMANSSNGYAYTIGISGNAYANFVGAAANAYSGSIGVNANAYANTVAIASNNYTNVAVAAVNAYVNLSTSASNTWANTVGVSGNAYVNVSTSAANNYAGAMANAVNAYTEASYATIGAYQVSNAAFGVANAGYVSGNANYTLTNAVFGIVNTVYGISNVAASTSANTTYDLQMRGFVRQSDTSISLGGYQNNTFTLANTNNGWAYYMNGQRYVCYGARTANLAISAPAANGNYWVSINNDTNGTLTVSTTAWNMNDPTTVPVAFIQYNSYTSPMFHLDDKRFLSSSTTTLDYYLHTVLGTRATTVGALSGYTVGGTSNANNLISVSTTILQEESLTKTQSALNVTGVASNNYITYYRLSSGPDVWTWGFSDMPYYHDGGIIQWDNNGTLTAGKNNNYYNSYLLFTTYQGAGRFIFVNGRGEFGSSSAAQLEDITTWDWSSLQGVEYVFAYQFTWFAKNSFNTSGKAQLAVAPRALNITTAPSASVPTNPAHNSLAGIQGGLPNTEFFHLTASEYGTLQANIGVAAFNLVNTVFGGANALGAQDNVAFNVTNAAFGVANAAYNNANVGLAASNAYSNTVGISGNAYVNLSTTSANAYAITIGASGNAYANFVGTAGNAYVNFATIAANGYSNTIAIAANNYTNASTTSANNYAGAMANAANGYTATSAGSANNFAGSMANSSNSLANQVAVYANSYANTIAVAANNYAGVMANSSNGYAVSVGAAANDIAQVGVTSANNYAGAMANSANGYAGAMANAANAVAATKVASVTGTSGQIFSSGGTTPTINLISTGVTAATYGGSTSIPVITVDAYGRLTSAANVAVSPGMDYPYVNNSVAAANNYAGVMANSANGYASTKLSNTSGTVFNGNLIHTGYITANNGLYSGNNFTGSFTDGIVVDYVTGNGRISVGTSDGLQFFAGGVGTNILMSLTPSGYIGLGTANPAYPVQIITGSATSTTLAGAIFDAEGTSNFTTQLNIRNATNGVGSSSDLVATADNGTDTTNFIDVGINSSGYNQAGWTINGADDGYVYTSDGALSIGTANTSVTNKYVSFFVRGTLASNEAMRIQDSVGGANVGIGTTNPQYKLDVAGTANIANALVVNGVNVVPSFASTNNWSNVYSNTVGVNANTYANTIATSANNYAGVMANGAGTIANAAFGAANQAGTVANNANTYAGSTYVKKAGDTITGDLVVQGNLTISGLSTSLNTSNLYIGDNMITLNADIPSSVVPVENAGIEINRGARNSNAAILWIESANAWSFTSNDAAPITTYIASNTDVVNAGIGANNWSNVYANTVGTNANNYANATFYTIANGAAAFGLTNTTYTAVNSAFGVINAAFGVANNAYTSTNGAAAFGFANGVSTNTIAAFGLTNTTYTAVNSAFGVINAAFGVANTALQNTSGVSLAGDLYIPGNVAIGRTTAGYKLDVNGTINAANILINGNVISTGSGSSVNVGSTPPSSPSVGNMWWDSNTGILFIYYTDTNGSQWVQASPSGYSANTSSSGYAPLSGATFSGTVTIPNMVANSVMETTKIVASGATGTISFNPNQGSIIYYTANSTANWTINVGWLGSTYNAAVNIGSTVTLAFMATQGAIAYYQTGFQIDGTSVTPYWQGASPPSSGNSNGIDVYTYTIVKTGSATYTVLASLTQF